MKPILLAICAALTAPQEPATSDAERVIAGEEVLETLREPLAVLSRGVLDLRLPDTRGRSVLAPDLLVRDLAGAPEAVARGRLGLGIDELRWPVEPESARAGRAELSVWEPFLSRVELFHHASFFSVSGDFTGDDRSGFDAATGFQALARLDSGELAAVQAELRLTWGLDGDEWRVHAFETDELSLTVVERPLFDDVLELALDPEDRARARRSLRDRALVDWIAGIRDGSLSVDETVNGILDDLADGTFHMDMSHVAVVDVDRDGFDDLYVLPSDDVPMMFRSRGDGTFEEVADELGLALEGAYGATFADFDNDGDPDAFLSRYPGTAQYLENAGGRFVAREALVEGSLPELVLTISAADADGDGLLDAYLGRYNGTHLNVMAGRLERARREGDVEARFPGLTDGESKELARLLFEEGAPYVDVPGPPNVMLRNRGDGRFERVSGVAALEVWRQTMAASWSDLDLDGDLDLYVVNEGGPNQLIENLGAWRFADSTPPVVSDVAFGMGLGIGDYDNDGRQDIYVTNMYSKAGTRIARRMGAREEVVRSALGNSLFRNGPDGFERVSGSEPPRLLVEAADLGWGAAFVDFDNDAHLDLYAPAGYVTVPEVVARPGDT